MGSGVFTGETLMTEKLHSSEAMRAAGSIVEVDTFEAVYRAWAPQVHAYCYRRLRSVENAEDATSQTFQQAFRGRAGFQGGSVPAWLFRIAERVIVDFHRANRLPNAFPYVTEMVDTAPGPDTQVIQLDEAARLSQAIAILPEARRRIIELRLAGLTSPEIAQILDRSPAWVRTNQRRAVLQLQAVLQDAPDRGGTSDV